MTWYRNNVLHVLAAPAFIACLMVNRRRGIRRTVVRRLFGSIFPYIRKELQMNADDSADRWLAHLQAAELVEMRGDGFVAANDPTQRYRLRLLAHTVMEVLERFYIAVALLADAGTGNLDRPNAASGMSNNRRAYFHVVSHQRAGVLRCAVVRGFAARPVGRRHHRRERRWQAGVRQTQSANCCAPVKA